MRADVQELRVVVVVKPGSDGLLDLMDPAEAFGNWVRVLAPTGVAVSTIGSAANSKETGTEPTQVNIGLEPTSELLERLVSVMDRHHLAVPVERRISLEDSPRALQELRAGRARGKTVIRLEQT